MFYLRVTIDKDVVEENQHRCFEIWLENIIHQSLKGGRGIYEAERHHQEFIMPLMSPKDCLFPSF